MLEFKTVKDKLEQLNDIRGTVGRGELPRGFEQGDYK